MIKRVKFSGLVPPDWVGREVSVCLGGYVDTNLRWRVRNVNDKTFQLERRDATDNDWIYNPHAFRWRQADGGYVSNDTPHNKITSIKLLE